jgi:hypothetical protein
MSKTCYQPSPHDVAWTRRLIDGFRTDIAFWGVPYSQSIYRVNRTDKTIELVHEQETGPRDRLFERLQAICADPAIGYTVSVNIQEITPEIQATAFPAETTGTGKVNTKIDLFHDPKESAFARALEHFTQSKQVLEQFMQFEPVACRYRCNACLKTFKTKVAHNCQGGHWSADKRWSEVYG